jgi:hypothetical protein
MEWFTRNTERNFKGENVVDGNEAIAKKVDELVSYVTAWEDDVKRLQGGGNIVNIRKGECHPRYHTIEYQQACQQILNDLGELFFSEGRVYIDEIEKIVIQNLDARFTRIAVADLMGISIRTVRNKLNERV